METYSLSSQGCTKASAFAARVLSFPQPYTHLFSCGAATGPRGLCPGAAQATQLLSGGSPPPLPPVKPELDPISCKGRMQGWSDGAPKEGTA